MYLINGVYHIQKYLSRLFIYLSLLLIFTLSEKYDTIVSIRGEENDNR